MQSGKVYIKDSSWWLRYRTPIIVSGQKKWKDHYEKLCATARFETEKQVRVEYHARISELLGEAIGITRGGSHLVSDFVDNTYFPAKKDVLRPSTLSGYRDYYKLMRPYLEGKTLADIKLPVAQSMLNQIAEDKPHVSSGLIKHVKWLGVAIFDFAKQSGTYDAEKVNPFKEVTIPPTKFIQGDERVASLDDVVAMIEVLDEPAATLIATAAFSGLRRSEIQGLRWEDLDGDELRVRRSAWRPTTVVEDTKTKASRAKVPVIPALSKYFKAHRNGFPPEGFIFQGPLSKKPLDLHNLVNRVILPTLREADIEWCGWHGFRRGLATTLYSLGVEAKTRQSILRHANIQVTENIYTQPVSKISKAAMAKVEKAFNTKLKAARKTR